MRLRECTSVASSGLSQVDRSEIEPLWIDDYHDGALSGAALHRGELMHFTLAEEEPAPYREGWYRRYWLVRLTPEQQAEQRRWEELFRTHVGTHWSLSVPAETRVVRPQEEHRKFYEAYSARQSLDLTENEVLGWIEL